ncbi:MAG: arginine--tRNA ligase [Clostridiales bacterium]|jgi:arginyl-tRNA synthetase|nr:arginine--tRNA ligase [Clostridiales bacterium]
MNFKAELSAAIARALGDPQTDFEASIEMPPNPDLGDFAFPCFKLASKLKKAPALIARDLCEKLAPPSADSGTIDFVDQVRATGGYVNFFLDKAVYAKEILTGLLNNPETYGQSDLGRGKTIVLDYSSPNIAKLFHVGHLYTTVIGNALYNIFKYLGYNCVGINHLGDWGTQFGQLICAYKKWGSKEAVESEGISEMTRLYVKFHQEAETADSGPRADGVPSAPGLRDEARAWFVKMQEGDQEALTIWKWFCDLSLREYNLIYDRLGVRFDYFTGESFYNDKMEAIVRELKEKNLLTESGGAMIVDLEPYGMPPCLILRGDGGTLYPTRDIAAAVYRHKTFGFHKCLIVTAMDQSLHFAQWFKVVELMGYPWAKDLVHVPYGLVSLEEGKFSTRKGNAVLMEDLLNEAENKTLEIINERNPGLADKDRVARQVGIGAVVFNDLYNSRIKDVVFSWERVLNFEGETGPYVQYAHARAQSVLKKADPAEGHLDGRAIDFNCLTDAAAFEIIKLLAAFPDKIAEAASKYEPFVVTRHMVALAQAFNRFYHGNPILRSVGLTRTARLALTRAVKIALAAGLKLLGIQAPDEM